MKRFLSVLLAYLLIINNLSADFSAKITKQIDISRNTEVEARVAGAQAILRGVIEVNPVAANQFVMQEKQPQDKNTTRVKITWTTILTPQGNITTEGLISELTLVKPFIKQGSVVLVKGTTPNELKIVNPKDKDTNRDKAPSSRGVTNITTGTSDPITPNTDNNTDAMEKPEYITTFDGCTQAYDSAKEVIRAYQRVYYLDKQSKEVEVQPCKLVKEYPANKKACETKIDYEKHIAYTMYQPYFTVGEDNEEYGAGGCVIAKQIMMMLDYELCPAKPMGDKYIKQGKWYYQNDDASKTYVTDCVVDPTGNENDLLIEFLNCEVMHDIPNAISKHLGKYYWIREDNTKEYLSDCLETKDSYFKHQLRWNTDQWQHFVEDGYSERVFTRFITIPSENREVIIDDAELEGVKYKHYTKVTWEHHDDLKRGAPNGYSIKTTKSYVKYDTQEYQVPNSTVDETIKHVFVSSRVTGKTSCGAFSGNKYYYKDTIRRGDNTTYETNEYDTGC